eukprot:CAMPEP_0197296600 /NCGR_PEP_ID=MMETSP0890-20130614/38759_1 /TAXON_ID=44058 ORGANISM="Aureoumbra lagunensis, Strain CCMP1510" /NCGR_SAMPLE_ID=MMETSP0890 /ASSEMBLY_ACC=CAM_ASM_000533 /LENGTH=536 /DNA_ID=CAMNT_0042773231 /DNA_START=123 /DNA_END=1733 /DNA_ORIENTATION=-
MLLRKSRAVPHSCEDGGMVYLSVIVESASVKNRDTGSKSDPYCKVIAGSTERSTSTKNNDNHPHWDETFDMGCVSINGTTITIHCFDDDGPANKDDSLLDEHLSSSVWFNTDGNGREYRLGGSSHHVDIIIYWLATPSAAPTLTPLPSAYPTNVPTPTPSSIPTITNIPTFRPTTILPLQNVFDAQFTDSKRYDRSDNACYDSPHRGDRIEIVMARVSARFTNSWFIVTDAGGPWQGLRVDGNSSFFNDCIDLRGTIIEVDGETRLTSPVILPQYSEQQCSKFIPYQTVATGSLGQPCSSIDLEALEGIPIKLKSNTYGIVLDYQSTDSMILTIVDDGSGPLTVRLPYGTNSPLAPPAKSKLLFHLIQGVAIYPLLDSNYYGLWASEIDFIYVENFTFAPTTLTPSSAPSLSPTSPAPIPVPFPTLLNPFSNNKKASNDNSSSGWIILSIFLVFIIIALVAGCAYYARFVRTPGSEILIRRRPYSAHSVVSEQTFEMGVVESIGYHDDSSSSSIDQQPPILSPVQTLSSSSPVGFV